MPTLKLPKTGRLLWLILWTLEATECFLSAWAANQPWLQVRVQWHSWPGTTQICGAAFKGQLSLGTKLQNVQTLWPRNSNSEIYSEIIEHGCQDVRTWMFLRVLFKVGKLKTIWKSTKKGLFLLRGLLYYYLWYCDTKYIFRTLGQSS